MSVTRDNRYLRFLPENLRKIYEESLEDSELLHLRYEIGIIDLHTKSLLERIDASVLGEDEIEDELRTYFPDIPEETLPHLASYIRSMQPDGFIDNRTFNRMRQKVERYQTAMEKRELRKADTALRELFRVIRDGQREGSIWDDIHKTLDRRERLVGAERSRLNQQSQMLAVEKVVLLLELVIESLRESVKLYVKDKTIQDHILIEAERQYDELIGARSGEATYQIEMDE